MGTIRERSERLLHTYPGVSRGSLSNTNTPNDDTVVKLSKRQTPVTGQIQKSECQTPSKGVKVLLSRLQAGCDWLTWHHKAYLADNPNAADDKRFSLGLEAWDLMERTLRSVFGYEGCIFGPGKACPADSPTRCDACMTQR